jgi:hypothetical protein
MRLLWLAEVLRDAGLTVHEYPGWRTRGAAEWGALRGVVCHATAGGRQSTDAGETRTLWVTGSTSAPAPISQCYLSRSGQWTVGASGRCNHVLVGTKGALKGYGNSQCIGVEAQNDNRGEPWSAAMLDSYQRGVAAICRRMGWTADRVVAHAEHQVGKSDPLGINMTSFRAQVARLIKEGDDMPLSDADKKWLRDNCGQQRVNPTLGVQYGTMARQVFNAVRPDRSQVPGARVGFLADLDRIAEQNAAILAASTGQDVLAAIENHAAQARQHREQVAEEQEARLADIADLIGQVSSGERPADEIVTLIGQRLARRAAGSDADDS